MLTQPEKGPSGPSLARPTPRVPGREGVLAVGPVADAFKPRAGELAGENVEELFAEARSTLGALGPLRTFERAQLERARLPPSGFPDEHSPSPPRAAGALFPAA